MAMLLKLYARTTALTLVLALVAAVASVALVGCKSSEGGVSAAERNAPPPAGGTQSLRPDSGGGTGPGHEPGKTAPAGAKAG